MRTLGIGILLTFGAALCAAQSTRRVVLGPQYRYNDGCAGPGCNRAGIWGSSSVTHASAGDSFVCAKASDGAQYCIADDTSGANYSFGLVPGAPNVGANAAVLKITGSPQDGSWSVSNVNPMPDFGGRGQCCTGGWTDGVWTTWKFTSITARIVGGVDYLFAAASRQVYGGSPSRAPCNTFPASVQCAKDSSIIYSGDYGATWCNAAGVCSANGAAPTAGAAMFPGFTFGAPMFVDYGPAGGACSSANPDNCSTCLYATATDGWNNRNSVYAGRVCNIAGPADVVNASKWEFVTAIDAAGNAVWGAYARAVPVYTDPGKVGMTGWTYLPDSRKYFSVQFYYPDPAVFSNTNWHFVECDHPWGPCAANLPDIPAPVAGSYGVSVNSVWSDFASRTLVVTCAGDFSTYNAAPSSTLYTLYAQVLRLSRPDSRPIRGVLRGDRGAPDRER